MTISLTPELDKYVDDLVKRGLFLDHSDVVRAGLRLLMERDKVKEAKLQALQKELRASIDALDSGQYLELMSDEALDIVKDRRKTGNR
ncbi:MAG: type II toxin-antitoxin system ParD family antitoxin [Armatimonadetes bacterium]|nr:type II toxin-antitoxin system ParD family antitoxin [Armatimonadota bacterium]